jgi:superfamily II DNA helicase RecQ
MQSLRLCNPLKSQQSFVRTNLKIRVLNKSGGVFAAMKGLVEVLNAPNVRLTKESTIVYALTRADFSSGQVWSGLAATVINTHLSLSQYT